MVRRPVGVDQDVGHGSVNRGAHFDRQGIVETYSSLLTAAVVVRLILILVLGPEFKP